VKNWSGIEPVKLLLKIYTSRSGTDLAND
jgi:hypothetical protein